MQNLLFSYAIDVFSPVAKWLVIGALSLAVIIGLAVLLIKKEYFSKFIKIALISLFGFLLLIGLTCLIMEIAKSYSTMYAEDNWLDRDALIKFVLIPLLVLALSLIASAVILLVITKKEKEQESKPLTKKTLTILGIINLIILIVAGVLMAIYYDLKFKNDGYYNSETASVNQPILYIACVLLIVLIVGLGFILDKNDKPIDTKCIALAGITVAMSFGLSYIKLFEMPQGGSVTLFSLLPIMIFSFIYGTKKGVFVCLIYGVLQAVQDPWIIHPAQFLLDYPIAFASIGLTGAFSQNKKLENFPQIAFLLGGILSGVVRFVCHLISGVFAFEAYAKGLNPWIYSLGYNSFVFVDVAIVLVVGVIVLSSKAFVKEMNKTTLK